MKLKENQKVYIRGCEDDEQGKRVIQELESRGGVNTESLTGVDQQCLYYIRENGEISRVSEIYNDKAAELLKEFYTEVKVNDVKVNEWPKKGHNFFVVGLDLTWNMMENKGDALSKAVIKSGNCFHSRSEADEVAKMFREIIKECRSNEDTY